MQSANFADQQARVRQVPRVRGFFPQIAQISADIQKLKLSERAIVGSENSLF
jgi:hypothetical protein